MDEFDDSDLCTGDPDTSENLGGACSPPNPSDLTKPEDCVEEYDPSTGETYCPFCGNEM